MKKMIFCLSLLALSFAGCGGDDGWGVSDYCSYSYEEVLKDQFDFSPLSQEQQDELRRVYMESCSSYMDHIPECKSEIIDNTECWSDYSDEEVKSHENEWRAISQDCENNTRGDDGKVNEEAFYSCLSSKNYPCAKTIKASDQCQEQNQNVLNNYNQEFNHDGGVEGKLTQKMQFWGLNINDYRRHDY